MTCVEDAQHHIPDSVPRGPNAERALQKWLEYSPIAPSGARAPRGTEELQCPVCAFAGSGVVREQDGCRRGHGTPPRTPQKNPEFSQRLKTHLEGPRERTGFKALVLQVANSGSISGTVSPEPGVAQVLLPQIK